MPTVRSEAKPLSSSHTVIASSSAYHTTSLPRPEVATLQRLLWIGNLLYYQLLAILTAVMLWVFFANTDLNRPILWHMVFSTISYIPLMAVAIIAFSQDNLPTLYISRVRIYVIHGILLTISCLGVTIGIAVKINDNIKNGSKHFQSNHAILGLTSWLLVFCAVCFGIVAQNTQNFAKYIKPVLAKLIHNVLGISAFTLGVVSIMVMYPSHHYVHFLPKSAYYASFLIAGYIIIWSLLAAFRSLYFQIKSLAF